MGGKRSRGGKPVCLLAALLMLFNLTACGSLQREAVMVDVTGQEAALRLAEGRALFAAGDYAGALRENEAVLHLAGHGVPVAEALFQAGLIHAHPGNPARDPEKALATLARLVRDDPGSALAAPAKGIAELIREGERNRGAAERSQRALAEMKQDHERLLRTIERLNGVIDELKRVDIDVDQKKREKGR